MTERLFHQDAYLREFHARVVSTHGDEGMVELDRTAFYATAGGQPHDTGVLDGLRVIEVIDEGERILHRLALGATSVEACGPADHGPHRLGPPVRPHAAAQAGRLVFARSADVALDVTALLRRITERFGGRGGGRPDLAQGSVAEGADLSAVLDTARAWAEEGLAGA